MLELNDLPSLLKWGGTDIHLYFASIRDYSRTQLNEFESILSTAELDYVCARKEETSRKALLLSHGLLRILLAVRTGINATNLVIEKSEYGKPFLSGAAEGLMYFSLAHSHEWILIAMSDEFELGVDLERINADLVTDQLFEDLSSKKEQQELASLQGMERTQRFFELWVEKESLLKATGKGLSGLSSILARDFDKQSYLGKSWQTIMLPAPAAYVAAISLAGGHDESFELVFGGKVPCKHL